MRFINDDRAAGLIASPGNYPFLPDDSPEQERIARGEQPIHSTVCTRPCCISSEKDTL